MCCLQIRTHYSKGGEKHEIYAAAFDGHLFYDLFSQGWWGGMDPLLGAPKISRFHWGFSKFLTNYWVDTSHGAVADPGRSDLHAPPTLSVQSFLYSFRQKL